MLKTMLIAGAGGFAGACCRYLVSRWCGETFNTAFPVGTFTVNIAGCFIIGLVFGLAQRSGALSAAHIALLTTGFCGGFTTFSSFANEIWLMGSRSDWAMCALYTAASILAGILMVWAGRALAAALS